MSDQPIIPQKQPYVKETKAGTYFWCACGRSDKQPFCDGSHKGTDFAPVKAVIEEDKVIAWCGCKHTNNECFCDGTHSTL
ncbi:CDGSH iron-sulfur domain-containing protein [Limibacter armeniacum]|uniref:CDGSH iron-sulfur domain-containing protein n=1 Tax=Limibacter armeniacum TaxID=466084 RepID=UPI002FE500CB